MNLLLFPDCVRRGAARRPGSWLSGCWRRNFRRLSIAAGERRGRVTGLRVIDVLSRVADQLQDDPVQDALHSRVACDAPPGASADSRPSSIACRGRPDSCFAPGIHVLFRSLRAHHGAIQSRKMSFGPRLGEHSLQTTEPLQELWRKARGRPLDPLLESRSVGFRDVRLRRPQCLGCYTKQSFNGDAADYELGLVRVVRSVPADIQKRRDVLAQVGEGRNRWSDRAAVRRCSG